MERYGFLKAIFLKLLTEKGKMSGYDFIKFCRESGINVSPGSVYPMITGLLKMGIIDVEKKGRKKLYFLTDEGKEMVLKLESVKKYFKQTLKKLGLTFECENLPDFVKIWMKGFFIKLKNVNWRNKKDIDELIHTLETFAKDLRRWKDGLRNRG